MMASDVKFLTMPMLRSRSIDELISASLTGDVSEFFDIRSPSPPRPAASLPPLFLLDSPPRPAPPPPPTPPPQAPPQPGRRRVSSTKPKSASLAPARMNVCLSDTRPTRLSLPYQTSSNLRTHRVNDSRQREEAMRMERERVDARVYRLLQEARDGMTLENDVPASRKSTNESKRTGNGANGDTQKKQGNTNVPLLSVKPSPLQQQPAPVTISSPTMRPNQIFCVNTPVGNTRLVQYARGGHAPFNGARGGQAPMYLTRAVPAPNNMRGGPATRSVGRGFHAVPYSVDGAVPSRTTPTQYISYTTNHQGQTIPNGQCYPTKFRPVYASEMKNLLRPVNMGRPLHPTFAPQERRKNEQTRLVSSQSMRRGSYLAASRVAPPPPAPPPPASLPLLSPSDICLNDPTPPNPVPPEELSHDELFRGLL